MSDQHKQSDPQLPLPMPLGDFIPISHLAHGRAKMAGLNFLRRKRAIWTKARQGRVATIEPPIGSDAPVERYPDGDFPE